MVLLEEVEAALAEEVAAAAAVEVEVEVEVKRVGTMNHFSPGNMPYYFFFLSFCQSLHDSQFLLSI